MAEDAVGKKVEKIKEEMQLEDMKTLDISNFNMEDFKAIPQQAAREPHPFDGYPVEKIKVGEFFDMKKGKKMALIVPRHSVVTLSPTLPEFQDPSGKNQSIKNTKTGEVKVVNIVAGHNRLIRDYDNGGINTDVVFDRKIKLSDGYEMSRCCLIPSHSVRAQLMFYYDDNTERVVPDNRYLFLDRDQAGRLRKLFIMIINPKLKNARLSKSISGESEESAG